jgi:hypothetical protein
MALRYYPQSKIKPNKNTDGTEYSLNGKPYKGKYYMTFDGKAFTGANPIIGKNELLTPIPIYNNSNYINTLPLPQSLKNQIAKKSNIKVVNSKTTEMRDMPVSYFPFPIDSDYAKGNIVRYFTKKINIPGYVIEISPEEYAGIKNGTVNYDISFWQTQELFWKITGPLHQKRISQYDIRAGIIDTNERLVEQANKTFIGIKDFIAGDYAKFAKPTE